MNKPCVDIIIPVWNKPTETRDCLVSLINYSPGARFILVDNGSERETERLLQDFAEGLDDRALLLSKDVNHGFVRAVNRGLARSEAPCIAVVRNTSTVSAGWLEPILDSVSNDPQTGIIVPHLVKRRSAGKNSDSGTALELSSGSFAAMLITRKVYDKCGGFDEEMDGGEWCLKDYSRRAGREGFLTRQVQGGPVYYEDEFPLGSVSRREEALRNSIKLFRERWGVADEFSVFIPKGIDFEALKWRFDLLHRAARLGNDFVVILPAGLLKQAAQAGYDSVHENLRLEALPLFFPSSRLRKTLARMSQEKPGIIFVSGVEGIPFPEVGAYITFSELTNKIGE